MNARSLHSSPLWCAAAALVAACLAPAASAQNEQPGDIVLRLAPGADITEVCERYNVTLISELSERALFRVRPALAEPGELVYFMLDGDPSIEVAEPDWFADGDPQLGVRVRVRVRST